MNEDFHDFLAALIAAGARFVVVGAHALAIHGVPRATGDLDVWIGPGSENADHVWAALSRFGAPLEVIGVTRADLERVDQVIQIGLPPRRIDVLTGISGVTFDEAWPSRVIQEEGGIEIPFLGRADLIRNKQASGRAKDASDLDALRSSR